MAVVSSNKDALVVNENGSITGPPDLVMAYSIGVMSRLAEHGFRATTTADEIVRMAGVDGCWFTGNGARVRRRMRKVAHELNESGYRATISGDDDGVSVLMVQSQSI